MIGQIYFYNLFISKRYYFCLFLTLIIGYQNFQDLTITYDYFYLIFHMTFIALSFLKKNKE